MTTEGRSSRPAMAERPDPTVPGARRGAAASLLRQVLQYIPGSLVPALVGVALTVVFTRVFESQEYGRYSLALSAAALTASLSSQWLQQAVTRFLPGLSRTATSRRLKGAIAASLGGILLLGVLWLVPVVLVLGRLLGAGWETLLPAAGAVFIAQALFNPLSAVLQAEMRPRRYTLYHSVSSVFRLALAVALVLVIGDVSSLLWAYAAALGLFIPRIWTEAALPAPRWVWRHRRRMAGTVRRMMRYGFPMVGWVVAAALLEVGDRYVIALVRDAGEVGIYAANYGLVTGAAALLTAPVLLAAHPFLIQAWTERRPDDAGRWLGVITEWFAVAGILVVSFAVLFARDLVSLLLGPEFREGYIVVPAVLAGVVVWQLGMYTHKPLEFAERTRLMLVLSLGAAALNLALNFLLVPWYGYPAAAYTTLISYGAYAVSTAAYGRRVLRWRVRWTLLLGSLVIAVAGVVAASTARGAIDAALGYGPGLSLAAMVLLIAGAAVLLGPARPLLRALGRRPEPSGGEAAP